MNTLEIFGVRLKALRKERRIYQREMGELLAESTFTIRSVTTIINGPPPPSPPVSIWAFPF